MILILVSAATFVKLTCSKGATVAGFVVVVVVVVVAGFGAGDFVAVEDGFVIVAVAGFVVVVVVVVDVVIFAVGTRGFV